MTTAVVGGNATGGTSTVFDPLTIPWYVAWRAQDATGASDGNPITGITDASGNSRPATVLDASHAPFYRASGINGLPAIDSVNTSRRASATFGPLTAPFSIVAVVKMLTLATFKAFCGNGGAAASFLLGTATSNAWREYAGTGFTNGTADTNAHLHVAEFNGASSIYTIDGSAVTGNPGTNTSLDGLTVCTGANGAAVGDYRVAEIFLINRVLTGTEKTNLHTYSQTKFATA